MIRLYATEEHGKMIVYQDLLIINAEVCEDLCAVISNPLFWDKFASRHEQKGTIGMPTARRICPSLEKTLNYS